jgi:hypothetical protein
MKPAVLGQEGMEVAASVVLEGDRLPVDRRLVRAKAANRIGDPLKAIGEVDGASAPDLFQAMIRKPSCLISCRHSGPAGGRSTSLGSHGRTKPNGALRRQRREEMRQDTLFKSDLFASHGRDQITFRL